MSHRGAEFRNKLIKRINHVFRVNNITTTPYNGFVENHNGTLKDQLHHYVESRQKDWDIFLPTVQLMYGECHLPAMGMFTQEGDAVRKDEGMELIGRRERTVQEEWADASVEALSMAWESTTARANANALRGKRAGRATKWEINSIESATGCELLSRFKRRKRIRSMLSYRHDMKDRIGSSVKRVRYYT